MGLGFLETTQRITHIYVHISTEGDGPSLLGSTGPKDCRRIFGRKIILCVMVEGYRVEGLGFKSTDWVEGLASWAVNPIPSLVTRSWAKMIKTCEGWVGLG
ncbi:hypothetical protein HanIR_Chr02g0052371 [Helianthus annuus]|nr:hypothetical protein HanIR_Chr02g0052371 [Helianthus annuus]